jgi:hypothetical protein
VYQQLRTRKLVGTLTGTRLLCAFTICHATARNNKAAWLAAFVWVLRRYAMR